MWVGMGVESVDGAFRVKLYCNDDFVLNDTFASCSNRKEWTAGMQNSRLADK